MPLFHFSLRNGEACLAAADVDLPDIPAANLGAIRFLGEMLQAKPEALTSRVDWHLDCTDAQGLILFTLMVLTMQAPAQIGS